MTPYRYETDMRVSDSLRYYELTLYMDLWSNEIVSHSLSSKRGDRMTYIRGLQDLISLKQQYPQYEMILHYYALRVPSRNAQRQCRYGSNQRLDQGIFFFNEQHPAYSLNYLTPVQYRE